MTPAEQEATERFKRDTAEHRLELRHVDGLYRHMRASAVGRLEWFDVITWPYNLIVNGSHGSFHFCRFASDTQDMFHLFRQRDIHPDYWAEGLRAGAAQSWSERNFRAYIAQEAADLEDRYPGIVEAVGQQILNSDEYSTEYEEAARYAVAAFSHEGVKLRYPDHWDVNFQENDWRYLWSCHGILWAIKAYDQAIRPVEQVAVVGGVL